MHDGPQTVVLLGARRQTLSVIRSLGPAGHRVLLARRPGSTWVERSRHLDGVVDLGDDIAAGLAALPRPENGPLWLYPLGDDDIAEVIGALGRLPDHVEALIPPVEATQQCMHKHRLYEIAEAVGVPCVRTEIVTDPARLLDATDRVGYPCVVKGDDESIRVDDGKALVLEARPDSTPTIVRTGVSGSGAVLVQPHFRGLRHDVYVFADHGRVVNHATVRTDRSDMPDGTGLGVRGVGVTAPEGMVDDARMLMEAIGYDGAACVQFLHDAATGRRMFLEINARLDANVRSVRSVGLDLPLWFLDHRRGVPVPELGCMDRPGWRFSWTSGDLSGLLRARRRGALTRRETIHWMTSLLAGIVRTDVHLSWDVHDPRPSLRFPIERLDPRTPRPTM